jgi:hypothetical protein
VSEDQIRGMGQVPAAEVAVARPAGVVAVDAVGLDGAERGRADDCAVGVVVDRGLVEAGVEAGLGGVAGMEKVLPVDIGDRHHLAAAVEGVELRIGVLFAEVENGEVVLPAVASVVAEEAGAEVGVVEEQAAEVAVEGLRAELDGAEVVVDREIAQVFLVENLLEGDIRLAAGLVTAELAGEPRLLPRRPRGSGDTRPASRKRT